MTTRDRQVIITQIIFGLSLTSYICLQIYGSTEQALKAWPVILVIVALTALAFGTLDLIRFIKRQNKEIQAEEQAITKTPSTPTPTPPT